MEFRALFIFVLLVLCKVTDGFFTVIGSRTVQYGSDYQVHVTFSGGEGEKEVINIKLQGLLYGEDIQELKVNGNVSSIFKTFIVSDFFLFI